MASTTEHRPTGAAVQSATRRHGFDGRHRRRVVRVLPLRHGGDARLQQDHVPAVGRPLCADHRGLRHLRRRLPRTSARRHRLRPLRRQVRTQEAPAARHHPRRRRDLPHGMPPHLRTGRLPRPDPPRGAALRAGLRRRRRVGRRGPPRLGALPRPDTRILGILAAGGCSARQPAGDRRAPGPQPHAHRGAVPLAGAGASDSGCRSSSSRSATTCAPG